MQFTTTFSIPKSSQKWLPDVQVLSIGSCFAENMGKRMENLPINILNQPFGTLFHPNAILKALQTDKLSPIELVNQQGIWLHPDYHSSLCAADPSDLMELIQQRQQKVKKSLGQSQYLLITWGTAYYYWDKKLKRPIANCHKQSANSFEKRLSSVEEIIQPYQEFIQKISKKNPDLRIILTVSPVRHTKDGIPENSVSKAVLRLAAETLKNLFPQVDYFPAYEIMLDELRDYRFYASDMIHPNDTAEEYIWQKFTECYFSEELLGIEKKWKAVFQTLHHQFHPAKKALYLQSLEQCKVEFSSPTLNYDTSKIQQAIQARILSIS
ncbi:GSCFA domain-containing protein [Aquirufa aurantiipilula]|uniref:GSCFA domain-containing protein n=1 Tax=Aquirufa aurantiipilula TaxID=2696561 RepID=A0ABT6BML3_9BACT|nr:GSCFA domain-containing protein [Aquirufa aurantiipilula]MDF5691578.1 GSCFA domain-containing protein [Aquirufa aurantiipilula]